MTQLLATWQGLDLRRRIVLFGAVGLTLIAVLSLAQIATRPGMALLYSGLDPAAAGEVVGALEQMNVEAEIRGDAIYVSEDARDRVRLSLAREGLPRQGQSGYELLDELSGFSATTDMFNAAYWRAKEGELARTLLASPGVRAARVHIAMPVRRPFAPTNAEPSASITVTMAGGALSHEQALAMRYMTALAVAGLEPEQVAVIDSRAGMILAPGTGNAMVDATAEAADREAKLKAELEQLLAARVGRDRARISVTVETDREAETTTVREIAPDSRVTIHSDTEEITDSSEGANGAVTVASNLPDGDAAADPTSRSNRSETRETVNYDYSETRRETIRQAGAIRRISVAVLVDGIVTTDANGNSAWTERPQEELDALRNLVTAAVGFDSERGDIVTVESMAFQPDATPGANVEISAVSRFLERNAMTLIQLGVLAIVAIILALTVVRPLLVGRNQDSESEIVFADGAMGQLDPNAVNFSANENGDLGAIDGPVGSSTHDIPPQEMLRDVVAERPTQTVDMLKIWLEDTDRKNEAA